MIRKKPPDSPRYAAIHRDELLPLEVLKTRLRWGNRTVSQAQRDGLRVLRYGKWKTVLGADLIEFLERVGAPAEV